MATAYHGCFEEVSYFCDDFRDKNKKFVIARRHIDTSTHRRDCKTTIAFRLITRPETNHCLWFLENKISKIFAMLYFMVYYGENLYFNLKFTCSKLQKISPNAESDLQIFIYFNSLPIKPNFLNSLNCKYMVMYFLESRGNKVSTAVISWIFVALITRKMSMETN